jgi:hypothetical protein
MGGSCCGRLGGDGPDPGVVGHEPASIRQGTRHCRSDVPQRGERCSQPQAEIHLWAHLCKPLPFLFLERVNEGGRSWPRSVRDSTDDLSFGLVWCRLTPVRMLPRLLPILLLVTDSSVLVSVRFAFSFLPQAFSSSPSIPIAPFPSTLNRPSTSIAIAVGKRTDLISSL